MNIEHLNEVVDNAANVKGIMQQFVVHQESEVVNLIQEDFQNKVIVDAGLVGLKVVKYLLQGCLKLFALPE